MKFNNIVILLDVLGFKKFLFLRKISNNNIYILRFYLTVF